MMVTESGIPWSFHSEITGILPEKGNELMGPRQVLYNVTFKSLDTIIFNYMFCILIALETYDLTRNQEILFFTRIYISVIRELFNSKLTHVERV